MNMNNYGRNEADALFYEIQQVSFAMDELRLFLDTHPENGDALALFDSYMKQRKNLVDTYTNKYGPIEAYYFNTANGWSWTNEPMPWKVEAN